MDTIEVHYNLQDFSFLNKLPLEPLLLDAELYTFLAATSNRKEYSELFLSSRPDTLIWFSWECGGPSSFYGGIGGPFNSVFCMNNFYHDLVVYCKTTTEEWGTPYDCQSVLPVEEFKNSEITISPNPVNEAFKIEGLDKAARIEIFNMQGQKIQYFEILPGREINAAALNTGMYLIKLHVNNRTVCKRIWKN